MTRNTLVKSYLIAAIVEAMIVAALIVLIAKLVMHAKKVSANAYIILIKIQGELNENCK